MTKLSVDKILKDLVFQYLPPGGVYAPSDITQAKQQFLGVIVGGLPKKIKCKYWGDDNYNKAIQDCITKIKEIFGEGK